MEGSGKTSYNASVMLFFNHILASMSWDRANCTEVTSLVDPYITITSFLILALKPENKKKVVFFYCMDVCDLSSCGVGQI